MGTGEGAGKNLSYRDAGVDIDAGNNLVEQIKPAVRATQSDAVIGGLGGFGGLFRFPANEYRDPVLVSGTDGVGTKLLLAQQAQRHGGIGIDLVAMCANDVVVQGARPLFFLDYYATGRLDTTVAREVIEGIAAGCAEAGAALIGGETAEMPGLYAPGHYDLAGFCVGVVERDRLIDGSRVRAGDRLLGLPSSGAHANGFSLIRRVLADAVDALPSLDGEPLLDLLLAPTRLYVRPLLALHDALDVHAAAHITGGGIVENLPRMLPRDHLARVHPDRWRRPALFDWLQQAGGIDDAEMWRTFNCGIGMILAVAPAAVQAAIELLRAQGQPAIDIGGVFAQPGPPRVVLE